ncbi:alanine racemase [Streptococcus halotolerans]|uniref:alanine racemase n=1 Tax=Streptococcus halotolerans TaxID=1814128 RepID=UPI000788E6CB|nr:alanine racemase [Streptococcus halotolerans]
MISSLHRPTKAKVNLDAISANIRTVVDHIPSQPKVWAVVKANAYGHGAIAVARHIEGQVDGFCVSNLDEAIELRQAGVTKSILILGVVLPEEVYLAIDYQLTLTIASLEWVRLAKRSEIDLKGLTCHIKIDSGMGRIGVRSQAEAEALIAELQEQGAFVEGIFTHFATADEVDQGQFEEQLAFFRALVRSLDNCPSVVHASNSATSIWHADTVFNAVRLGVIIYGLNPSGTALDLPYDIEPALHLESALVHVKEVPAGASVGYGGTYHSPKAEWIGTLPIGYADGWTRDMQDFDVLVDGQLCQMVGRVSMDQTTIRLPKKYPLGTKVTLIGKSGDQSISATDVAEKRGTINYEVLCLISDRVPREY